MKIYSRLAIGIVVLGALALMDTLFTGPLAFVTGWSDVTLGQWIAAAFAFALTLLITRVVKREIIHGWLERRSGKQVPQLIGSIISGLVMFIGICLILALVFKRDITALVATGGASAMIIGIAVRDIILALFTGILLNVERPFKVGDMIKINDKIVGKVERITWRTTVVQTRANDIIYVPNLSLANAVILNQAQPDSRSKRAVEVLIDYDTSVESAERILYAAVLGATGFKQVAAPSVFARRMERDGVVYEVAFTIADYMEDKKSEHAVIKSILKCMRDAEITVSFPKSEVIHSERRVHIANRSLDVFRLVQQCRLFRNLPDEATHRISKVVVERHFAAGATIVQASERRHAIFIIGEGMAKRTLSNRDGSRLVQERFIATEFFGRSSLFACQPQAANVLAETAVLAYELDRAALEKLFEETPELINTLAKALSYLSWNEAHAGDVGVEPPPEAIGRLFNLYRGQIEANYAERLTPAVALLNAA
ncbi:MAG: mechanosensitive ion channel family protein [Sulfuricella sp.]|nr:mechanosensitive ion channel family protein [Sulfuricella sp.]